MNSELIAVNAAGITTPRNADTERNEVELGDCILSPVFLDP